MRISIMQTNDMHGTLDAKRLELLQAWRAECDLYFDTGDAIKTGNLGIPVRTEPVWAMLEALGCDAGVLGNRETHVLTGAFEAKLAGSRHPILCANLKRRDGSRPLPTHLIMERNGVKIGIVGVMVPMVTERMKTQFASAYLWDPPIETALAEAEQLKPKVDVLFALTHIGHRQDVALAEKGVFGAIFGGHSHTVLMEPQLVGTTWIAQGGSHNRFAGIYTWDGALKGGLRSMEKADGANRRVNP